ncbi:hypothetical protein BS78_05G058300 [Paspalum vaginatum]|nr:hypothetical protein BS78_05G058300 [Paspalum vaginatum]
MGQAGTGILVRRIVQSSRDLQQRPKAKSTGPMPTPRLGATSHFSTHWFGLGTLVSVLVMHPPTVEMRRSSSNIHPYYQTPGAMVRRSSAEGGRKH